MNRPGMQTALIGALIACAATSTLTLAQQAAPPGAAAPAMTAPVFRPLAEPEATPAAQTPAQQPLASPDAEAAPQAAAPGYALLMDDLLQTAESA